LTLFYPSACTVAGSPPGWYPPLSGAWDRAWEDRVRCTLLQQQAHGSFHERYHSWNRGPGCSRSRTQLPFWGESIRANFRCGDSRGYRSIQEARAGLGYYGTISPYHVGPGADRHLTRRREEREEVRLGGATRASRLRV